ncbi:MAG: NAD-dependent epimerase/dehydratase family protein [Nitrosopumilaceae archaeon]|nr:NAD-dependent epimerase/dehydratase family protein [Nitrosopumilaceae archaeon]
MAQEITDVVPLQNNPFSIMVTGATGFIGSKLIRALSNKGYSVKGMSRREISDKPGIKYVKTDVFDLEQLTNSLKGIEVAYYLLHSMEGSKENWKDFATREKIQAQNFLKASTDAGVKRIIYLGGLVNANHELSPHMQSRKKVGEILASGSIPVTELRASLIIGAEGGSYAMLRYLVERLRVMVCPSWVKSLAQPIAVDDVVDYLVGCMENKETTGKIYDIGGPDKMTYEELMRVYAAYLNKNLFVLQIPFLTTRLSSYWVDLITPVKASLARPLIDSLVHDTVVQNNDIKEIIPLNLKSVRESIDIATKEIQKNPPQGNSKVEKTGFKINQKILMISLFAYAICGTTYYWLDDRPEVYEPLWLTASALWYVVIGFSILFVYNKTRLGYLMAGILTWFTLVFWIFDNFHVAFQMSLISKEPNVLMTIRNFVGIVISSIAVVSSHNLFHKVVDYQYKGKPV